MRTSKPIAWSGILSTQLHGRNWVGEIRRCEDPEENTRQIVMWVTFFASSGLRFYHQTVSP
jgi:hypothetical protein